VSLILNTINWEDGSETNFPASKAPELEIKPGTELHDKLIEVIRRESKEKIWTSLVVVILAT
jgi:hypothetical protein